MRDVLKHLLSGQNQFASGGLLLMIFGSVGVFLRSLPEFLWSWLVRQFTLTITVKDDDAAFAWVKEWFLEQPFSKRLRQVDLAHENAAVLFEAHQSDFFEAAKGLADRSAADAEAQRHLRFADPGAGRKRTGKDQLLDLLLGDRRHGSVSQQVQRAFRGGDFGHHDGTKALHAYVVNCLL